MTFSNQRSHPKSMFDQVIDYCWSTAADTEIEAKQKYRRFWELMNLYVSGNWDTLAGSMAVKEEDVDALL